MFLKIIFKHFKFKIIKKLIHQKFKTIIFSIIASRNSYMLNSYMLHKSCNF